MLHKKTYHLIFATDGKGTTQLAHVYAGTFEQASQAAIQWRNERHPDLTILKVRAEPNGFQVGLVALAPVIEEEREGATFVDVPTISLPGNSIPFQHPQRDSRIESEREGDQ